MARKVADLQRRMARIEQKLANIAEEQESATCTCGGIVVALDRQPEQFEAEMNRTCPVHGFRRFRLIVVVACRTPDGSVAKKTKLDALLEEYTARGSASASLVSRLRRVAFELKHASQEL